MAANPGIDLIDVRVVAARIVAVLSALAIVCRLAGVGLAWLPSTGVLALLLGLAHLADWFLRGDPRLDLRTLIRERAFALGVVGLMLLTLAVRLPGLNSELGHVPLDIDEHRLAANIQHYFVTGELVHTTVEHYPGLAFWLFAGAAFVSYVRGLSAGALTTPAHLSVGQFVGAARIANVLVAAGIVACTARIGRRLAGPWAGLAAGAVVAIVPLSVDTTTLCRCDPVMVLVALAAVDAALEANAGKRLGLAVVAGALAGVAAGVKYSGVFCVVPALLAAVSLDSRRARVHGTVATLAAFVVALAVTNHFVWWDFPNFLVQLVQQVAITGRGHWAATDNPAGFYMMILDRFGPGVGLMAVAAAFAVCVLTTRRWDRWIVLSFPLLYLAVMTSRPSQFPRWVFPLLPFVAIAAFAGLAQAFRFIGSRFPPADARRTRALRALAVVAVVALVAQPVWAGIVSASRRFATPTHVLAERWIAEHVAAGAVVVVGREWLDLSATSVQVRRVDDLKKTLDGGLEALGGAQWVVVPEPYYGHPTLQSLGYYDRIHGEPRFGSGTGYDYSFYAVPQR